MRVGGKKVDTVWWGGGVQMKGIKGEGEAGKSNIEQSFLSSREGKTWVT